MRKRTHGLRGLGICLMAALGLLAIGAASAQAEGTFRVNGANLGGAETAEVASEEDVHFTLLLTLNNGETAEILCESFNVDEGRIEKEGKSLAKLKFFKNCVTRINGVLNAACKPTEPIVATAKDLLILHNGKSYDLFEPDEGTRFVTLHFTSTCVFGETVPIKGSAVVEDCNGLFETEEIKHLVQQAPQALFPTDVLQFGSLGTGTLDGSAWLKLAGVHAGQKWSGIG